MKSFPYALAPELDAREFNDFNTYDLRDLGVAHEPDQDRAPRLRALIESLAATWADSGVLNKSNSPEIAGITYEADASVNILIDTPLAYYSDIPEGANPDDYAYYLSLDVTDVPEILTLDTARDTLLDAIVRICWS